MASLRPLEAAQRRSKSKQKRQYGESVSPNPSPVPMMQGEEEVVKSKLDRGSNGVLKVGGASPYLRGADQAVPFKEKLAKPAAILFKDRKTKLVMRKVFGELCAACAKHVRQVERELARLEDSLPEDARTVKKVVYHLVTFIRETNQVPSNLDSFLEEKWTLRADNIHMEFSRVAYETFRDSTNWGRVIMFLGFAVSFAVYLEQGLVVGSAESVLEWTCQVVEENLGEFYTSNGGWVSEQARMCMTAYTCALHQP